MISDSSPMTKNEHFCLLETKHPKKATFFVHYTLIYYLSFVIIFVSLQRILKLLNLMFMNTITLKEPIDFQKYQLIVNFLENIGVEIQTADYETFVETETPTEEELRAVEEGLKDIEAGNIVPHEKVMQGARNIIESYKEKWRKKEA